MIRGDSDYKQVKHGSSSNEELVVLLFERALRQQLLARKDYDDGNYIEGSERLRKVREIYGELIISLDHSAAPELSDRLARLYVWMMGELGRAAVEKSNARLKSTIKVTHDLMEGFASAFRGESAEAGEE
jgi:flagellar biosynthetic protein FliS